MEKLKKLFEQPQEEEVEEQRGVSEGGEVQLDEEEIHETTRTIMTMMMIVMVGVQLVEVEEELREEEVEGLVRGVRGVEGEVPMQVGRGGPVMVYPPSLPVPIC